MKPDPDATMLARAARKLEARCVDGPGGCRIWTGLLDSHGYGRLMAGRVGRAHRLAWMIAHGPVPHGLFVCHRCDNPPCCNPAHLFLGTQVDNVRDCVAKDRHARGDRHGTRIRPESSPRGERHWAARLTDEDVLAIRAAYRDGAGSHSKLAKLYGCSQSHICGILNHQKRKGTAP